MGFEVPETTLKLRFSDPSFHGLEVKCRTVSIEQVQEAAALNKVDAANVTEDDLEKINCLLDSFANALISWNLTRNGKKIPATRKGVKSLDIPFAMLLVTAWMQSMGELIAKEVNETTSIDIENNLPVESL